MITKVINTIKWLIVLIFLGWFFNLKYSYKTNLKELNRLNAIIDSIEAIKQIKPDTIIRDTIIYRDTTIFVVKEFEKPTSKDTIKHYRDSVVNSEIRVWVDLYADKLFNVEWNYQPVINQKEKIIEKPYPVIVDRPIETIVEPKGFYATGGIGFGDGFIGRIGIGYMPNSRRMYGIDISKYNNQTVLGVNATIKIFAK